MKKIPGRLAVIDFETDPFKFGRVPKPFAAGFYDGEVYLQFWGDDCASQLLEYLISRDEKLLIYAHNGGKFDFYFLLELAALENPLKIINSRIVKAKIGKHELRDSYAILPIPLGAWQKDTIDYALFERDVREKHKGEILKYLKGDCLYLFELVEKFVLRFGAKLTIGGTSMGKIREIYPFELGNERHDAAFREYYFGGRVQCFEMGLLQDDYKIFDVNSMYPHAMRDYDHPTGMDYIYYNKVSLADLDKKGELKAHRGRFFFIHFIGKNNNALPIRTKAGLDFTVERGEFYTTSHELKVALQLNLIEVERILFVALPRNTTNFSEFVDKYSTEKTAAKLSGDKASELFAKFLQNSGYGKFAQNPANYYDYQLRYPDMPVPAGHEMHLDYGGIEIWRKPSESVEFFDVATAASITSASRSILLMALSKAIKPIYCDTDSIICRELPGVEISESKLGAWKFEGEGNLAAIAGKKLYALLNNDEVIKIASKGVRLSADEIIKICRGEEIIYNQDAPSFKLTGATKFTTRKIKRK